MKKAKKLKITQAEYDGDVIYPSYLTATQQKEAKTQLAAARKKTQQEMTDPG